MEDLPSISFEGRTAGPIIREELERLRAEMRASMERSRIELDRNENLLTALKLHDRRIATQDERAGS